MRLISAFIMLLAVAACQNAPQSYTLSPVTFAREQVIRVNVAKINVIDETSATKTSANIEQKMSMPPADALRIWAKERLQAVGQSGSLEITLSDASIKEVSLPVREGFQGFISDEQNMRYDGSLKATLRLYDGQNAMSRAEGDVSIMRSHTINEKATIADREKLWHDMATDMALSFDKEAELRLRQYFSPYLR
jgi:hypothetical protein